MGAGFFVSPFKRRAMLGRFLTWATWLRLLSLCLLALPELDMAAQPPHRQFGPGKYHPRRGDVQRRKALVRRKLVQQEYERPPCEWCHERMDGTHADTLADPPCSGFFTCHNGQLVHLDACPGDLCFDEATGSCIRICQGSCSSGRATAGGAGTAQAYKGRQQSDGMRVRGQHPRAEGSGFMNPSRRLRQLAGVVASKGTQWPQVNALLAFRRASFDPVGALRSWVLPRRNATAASSCRWEGVTCGGSNSTDVVALILSAGSPDDAKQPLFGDQSLMQSIPPHFGNLTALTSLDLSYLGAYKGSTVGGLVGSIPSELGNCTNLQTLNLQWNALSGSLPDSLSKLQKLTSLILGSNLFSAPFPTLLTTLSSLSYLSLYYTGFSGPIPQGISNLKLLTNLVISNTPVTGELPLTLGALPNLQYLKLEYLPYVQGRLPLGLSGSRNLRSLRIRDMNLTGDLPSARWWGKLRNLAYLEISSTNIRGTLPSGMPKSLGTLIIEKNQISGPIPGSLIRSLCANKSADSSFSWLGLSHNRLRGTLPMQLSLCSLGYLFLQDNLLKGEVLPQLRASLGTLQDLKIGGNRFSGTLGEKLLLRMSTARNVNVSWNRFTGAVPKVMHAPSSLLVYDVSGNLFEGNVADLLQGNVPAGMDLTLALSHSRFSGRVPESWLRGISQLRMDGNPNVTGPLPDPTDCKQLHSLDTSRNHFSGGIPKGLLSKCPLLASWRSEDSGLSGGIPSPGAAGILQQLLLSGNRLSGPFPSGISLLRGLNRLDVSRNALRGPLLSGLSLLRNLNELDVSRNALEGPLPSELSLLQNLQVLDVSRNALEGAFPTWLTSFPKLESLDASFNGLSGPLFPQLRVLTLLSSLSLSHNKLDGSIPLELAPPNLASLHSLNLSSNRLSGLIPWGFNSTPTLTLDLSNNQLWGQVPGYNSGALSANTAGLSNNSGLCGGAGYPPCPYPGLSTGELVGLVLGSVLAAVLVGGVLALGLRLCAGPRKSDQWDGVLMVYHAFDPPLTARALVDATGGFSDEHLLGRGGFGSVYKAELPDQVVAVKRLQVGSEQGHEEFKAELEFLGSVRHRNLVRLLAAYVALPPHNERLLVYDFLTGGSLDSISCVETRGDSPYRSFAVRVSICTDVARGLNYLHHGCRPGIVHCDMKPGNVLLDEDLVAKVADFGLAKAVQFEKGKEHMSVEMVFGTPGFVAPEFFIQRRLGFKSDVYAYGVTIIQIITGRRTNDDDIAVKGLWRWASAGGRAILDPSIVFENEEEKEMAVGIVKLGALCIARVPMDRPPMEDVLRILENLEEFVRMEDVGSEAETSP